MRYNSCSAASLNTNCCLRMDGQIRGKFTKLLKRIIRVDLMISPSARLVKVDKAQYWVSSKLLDDRDKLGQPSTTTYKSSIYSRASLSQPSFGAPRRPRSETSALYGYDRYLGSKQTRNNNNQQLQTLLYIALTYTNIIQTRSLDTKTCN
ncbi:hypothetical protein KC326_g194 [Hortaea werneckii]|nr:hypothetical protein KC326_g194 [Hortaea werneckii]